MEINTIVWFSVGEKSFGTFILVVQTKSRKHIVPIFTLQPDVRADVAEYQCECLVDKSEMNEDEQF